MPRRNLATEDTTIRVCLIDNKEKNYHACSLDINVYLKQEKNMGWKYIGSGRIYKIDGVPQNSKDTHHFWIKD